MKILCTGDVHIGRTLSRIPDWYESGRVPSSAAWESIINLAIREQVDLVAISGDLVDHANRYYEAINSVEIGVNRLRDAGIRIVAVAGNHDFDVLPRVVDRLDGAIHLLGRGGHWERWSLNDDAGNPRLHVDGWSFPAERVRTNPTHSYQLDPIRDAPVLGLIHVDLGLVVSEYAPVNRWDLERLPPAAWLLGHIHSPTPLNGGHDKHIFYPGSPFALDPGEPGIHGVVMLTIDETWAFHVERVAIAPVRYDHIEIDLSAVGDSSEAELRIENEIRAALQNAVATIDGDGLELLVLRVVLTGRLQPGVALDATISRVQQEFRYHAGVRNAAVKVEQIENRTASIYDLELLAAGIDAPSEIARMLLALDDPDSALRKETIAGARVRANAIARKPGYRDLGEPDLSDEALAVVIARESHRLLDALMTREGGR